MASKAADLMWEMLENAGVKRCYGIVGDALNPVIDALHRNGKIEFVHVRHDGNPAARELSLIRSCLSKYTDAARRTRSFIRKATLSVIAGNPPADFSQAFGKNGMIVTVATNEKHEPMAPRIPNFLFQNPENNSAPNNHSETPKKRPAPRMPKTGYIQEISGPCSIRGINACAS